MDTYGPSPINRSRRSQAELSLIEDAMIQIVADDNPMTLRGLFYRLAAGGIVQKTDAEYKNVGRYLLKLRREGRIPYAWISDNTRWMRKPRTYDGLESALWHTANYYRRALWRAHDAYIEVWCEKDALAGLLMMETDPYDVPLMVARGFSSETFLHSASETLKADGRRAFLYLLTDLDPAGLRIAADVEKRIRRFAPDSEITVTRLGVTRAQVTAWNLPTRPTKRGDIRAKDFDGESVDLDAIPPRILRQLVRDAIERHIDRDALAHEYEIERIERDRLEEIALLFEQAA